ncbi:MAG: hypothetical protein RJR37_10715 [Peptococcaceae bacterium MAG4]|jgi:uncharacterized coiled-coil DUF342 family protein|nr:hypothetical protein [Peptococcaceae bacterium MAG4]NLW38731.1 hypothetical protein [Peptococcaceae bacterium]
MPDTNELVNILRAVIQEELIPVNERLSALEAGQQELRQGVQELRQDFQELRQGQYQLRQDFQELRQGQHELRQDVQKLKQDVQELKKGQAALEAVLNDLRTINRRTHIEIFSQLNAIWNDIKLLSSHSGKVVR